MSEFFVHRRHTAYRLATKADASLPCGASGTEVREAVRRDGYSLFKDPASPFRNSKDDLSG
jgi:hypothetical protein